MAAVLTITNIYVFTKPLGDSEHDRQRENNVLLCGDL
jgi:hypothetical protein